MAKSRMVLSDIVKGRLVTTSDWLNFVCEEALKILEWIGSRRVIRGVYIESVW